MKLVWQVLVGNLACVALFISAWMHVSYRFYLMSIRMQRLCFGAILGFAAIVSMLMSVEFEPGIYFDLRIGLIGVSALFGGPLSVLVTAIMALAFRLGLGGAGVTQGMLGILTASIMGLVAWWQFGRDDVAKFRVVVPFALSFAVLSLAVLVFLPRQSFEHALTMVGLPIAILNFFVTAVAGVVIIYFQRFTLERDILQAALTQAPDFHYVKDLQQRFVITNRNVARHHGRETSSQMVGLSDFDLETPERAKELAAREQAVLQSGVPVIAAEEMLAKPGEVPRWYSTTKVPLRNRHGDLIGLAGVTLDITERKRLERELEASRNVMTQAMTEMSDGLSMFDKDGFLIFCNDQYRSYFPRSSYARVTGAHISDIFRAVVRNGERKDIPTDLSEEAIQAAAASLHTDKDEVIPLVDDRWLNLRTRVTKDGSALVVVSDMTAVKMSELQLRTLADEMKGLAQTDGLTGLANRRSFDEAISRELGQLGESSSALSLLLIDVDRFKSFNDTYGHPVGDDCLQKVGRCLEAIAKRTRDVAARYGGEEFAILLPETDSQSAAQCAEHLCQAIRNLEIEHVGSEHARVTISIGIAVVEASEPVASPAELVARADAALYRSKNSGRDRATLFLADNVAQLKLSRVKS